MDMNMKKAAGGKKTTATPKKDGETFTLLTLDPSHILIQVQPSNLAASPNVPPRHLLS
jgi:hypothetical protein